MGSGSAGVGGHRRAALLPAALVLAGLAGCAHRPPPVAAVQQAPAALPEREVDGTYRGPMRLVQANARGCPRSAVRSVVVFDRSFEVQYRSTPSVSQAITATVADDGSIHGGDGVGEVDGRLHDGLLDLTVASQLCQTRMVLRRQ